MQKKTLVIGASPIQSRYSNRAVKILNRRGFDVIPLGIRNGMIDGIEIVIGFPELTEIHTVTMYIGHPKQIEYYDYILSLKPKRLIFNPGSENDELEELLNRNSVEIVHHCTLVMLLNGDY